MVSPSSDDRGIVIASRPPPGADLGRQLLGTRWRWTGWGRGEGLAFPSQPGAIKMLPWVLDGLAIGPVGLASGWPPGAAKQNKSTS